MTFHLNYIALNGQWLTFDFLRLSQRIGIDFAKANLVKLDFFLLRHLYFLFASNLKHIAFLQFKNHASFSYFRTL